jgi:hypothetical protein
MNPFGVEETDGRFRFGREFPDVAAAIEYPLQDRGSIKQNVTEPTLSVTFTMNTPMFDFCDYASN